MRILCLPHCFLLREAHTFFSKKILQEIRFVKVCGSPYHFSQSSLLQFFSGAEILGRNISFLHKVLPLFSLPAESMLSQIFYEGISVIPVKLGIVKISCLGWG